MNVLKLRINNVFGLSLIEILVVLAIMVLLSTLVVPRVTGFISSGKSKAWDADRDVLQVGVDGWRNIEGKATGPEYPILAGGVECLGQIDGTGDPIGICNPYIDMFLLASGDYLTSASSMKSADTSRNTTATNPTSGSYGWYVDSDGVVASFPTKTTDLYP